MSMTHRAALAKLDEQYYTDDMDDLELAYMINYLVDQDHKPWCRTHTASWMPNYGSDCTCGQWLLRDMLAVHWDEGPEAVARYLNGRIDWKEAR